MYSYFFVSHWAWLLDYRAAGLSKSMTIMSDKSYLTRKIWLYLPNENKRCLYQKPQISMCCVIKINTSVSPIHNPTSHRRWNERPNGKAMVVYMSSGILQLAVRSRGLSQAEKKLLLAKLRKFTKWQLFCLKTTTIGLFRVKIVVILLICSALQEVISFSSWDKSRDPRANSPKLEDM